jgi:hypothetical protein
MPFELTINRVGAFCGATNGSGQVERRAIEGLFRARLADVAGGGWYPKAIESIIAKAPKYRDLGPDPAPDLESQLIRIRSAMVPKSEADWTLIGTLPGLRFECTTTSKATGKSRAWITLARASVTGCALQTGRRHTKLWWTFEGVPADDDPRNRPSGDDVSIFIGQTDAMADAAILPLYEAVKEAFTKVQTIDLSDFALRPNRIRVRMSDTNDLSVEALLDAVYYQHYNISDVRDAPGLSNARKGLLLFEKFVRDVTHRPIQLADRSLEIEGRFDGFKGIIYRTVIDHNTIVAGFGHQSGSVSGLEHAVAPEKRKLEKQENVLRAMSPSRPISAMLADEQAAALEPTP